MITPIEIGAGGGAGVASATAAIAWRSQAPTRAAGAVAEPPVEIGAGGPSTGCLETNGSGLHNLAALRASPLPYLGDGAEFLASRHAARDMNTQGRLCLGRVTVLIV